MPRTRPTQRLSVLFVASVCAFVFSPVALQPDAASRSRNTRPGQEPGLAAARPSSQKLRMVWWNWPETPMCSHLASAFAGVTVRSRAMNVDCMQIRFSQDSISDEFSDGGSVHAAIDSLNRGDLRARDFPKLRCYWSEAAGTWVTLDNRRLYCFQESHRVTCVSVEAVPTPRSARLPDGGGWSVRVRQGFGKRARSADFYQTDCTGCWVSTTQEEKHTLWYCDAHGEYGTGYVYPEDSKFVKDGCGGVFVLCNTTGTGNGLWTLWHVDADREWCTNFHYPMETKMISDGEGGCWLLAETRASKSWVLWHATPDYETRYFEYPANSRVASDGVGGVWILCKSSQAAKGQWGLWHAESSGEHFHSSFPAHSKLAGDGQGGCWIVCLTDSEDDQSTSKLWHVTEDTEFCYYDCPERCRMVSDECGGVWILRKARRGNKWRLWNADQTRERNMYEYPGDSNITAGNEGCWVLCNTTGADEEWRLWHATLEGETELYGFPAHSTLITDVSEDI